MLAGAKASDCDGERNTKREYPNHNGADYQCAIDRFYERTRLLPEATQRLERNRIQERILAVSEDRCNAYKRYLRYDQSMSNFWMGAGATLAGGLGALSPTLTAAKTYAATGGILSGFSAEYNQDFYGNLFYSVITKAIDEQRRDAYRQIQAYGQGKNLIDYPVEAAIKDAILYDGTCSAVSAMEYAEKAVQLVNDPGMDSMMRYFVKANQSRYILQNGIKDISELKNAGITTTFENSRFGSQIGSKDKPDPLANINSQLEAAGQQTAQKIVENIGQRYAANDEDKKKAWANRNDKEKLTGQITAQLGKILEEHSKSMLLCAAPAETLNHAYLKAQAQLSQTQDTKNLERAEAQVKREQALNGLEQVNIEVTTIARRFNDLLEELTDTVLDQVFSSKGDKNDFVLDWGYDKLADNKKFSAAACAKFNVPGNPPEPPAADTGKPAPAL